MDNVDYESYQYLTKDFEKANLLQRIWKRCLGQEKNAEHENDRTRTC